MCTMGGFWNNETSLQIGVGVVGGRIHRRRMVLDRALYIYRVMGKEVANFPRLTLFCGMVGIIIDGGRLGKGRL